MKKPVYLYDVNMNFIKEFKTTYECAEFFDKDVGYINHNLKYYQKIRKDGVWYIIKRDFEKEKKYEDLCKEIDTILDFSFFKKECPLNFGFGDKKEEKAQDVFYEDKWCEKNCDDNYKKCWLKYFDKLKELKEIK